jgi:hypothetical protein
LAATPATEQRTPAAPKGGSLPYPVPFQYTDRAGKARYIAAKYAPVLSASLLDVGCDQRQLLGHLPRGVRYVGLDIAPPADVVLNLDTPGAVLPFGDGSFDTVLAADVLEHLERIHAVFDEFCRVAAGRVIVSLPNPVHNFIDALTSGGGGGGGRLKFYGLPIDPPKDRHRWFFGAEEAAQFLRVRGERNGFQVEQIDQDSPGCPKWSGPDGRNYLSSPNITAGTTWCVLRRA